MSKKQSNKRDTQMGDEGKLLTMLEAAIHLGITPKLLSDYTKNPCGGEHRTLKKVQGSGKTCYKKKVLDEFDNYLREPWPEEQRVVPPYIKRHLDAESRGLCARCAETVALEYAHIESWKKSKSHYHHNLILLCSNCHKEHDRHKTLPTEELRRLKAKLIKRTCAELTAELISTSRTSGKPALESTFCGRKNELEELRAALNQSRTLLLRGTGGIGKTQLLLHSLASEKSEQQVMWLNVEEHKTADDILAEISVASGGLEFVNSLDDVAMWLDKKRMCVVFDGVESIAEDARDDMTYVLADLVNRTQIAQLVVTSQIDLSRVHFEKKILLTGLDAMSSKFLLHSLIDGGVRIDQISSTGLLTFADGHPLAIQLIARMANYLGSARNVLNKVRKDGSVAVELPKWNTHDRVTSLARCLSLAYEMLTNEEKRTLFLIANCPSGLFKHQLESYIGEDTDISIAGLRYWSLLQLKDVGVDIDRWYALSPIRSFVKKRWQDDNEKEATKLRNELIRDFALFASYIEKQSVESSDIPNMTLRFRQEWPNILMVVEMAENHPKDQTLVNFALSVCESMTRFFFVSRLPKAGVQLMLRGFRIAKLNGRIRSGIATLVQAVALAQRSSDPKIMTDVESVLKEVVGQDDQTQGELDVAWAMLENQRGDYHATEKHAKRALLRFNSIRRNLHSSPSNVNIRQRIEDNNNDLAGSHHMLGEAYKGMSRHRRAQKQYRKALKKYQGASLAVNEGQINNQIGMCKSSLQQYGEAIDYFSKAAVIFQATGMREYLANALGHLGIELLYRGESGVLPTRLTQAVLDDGFNDAVESLFQSFNSEYITEWIDSEWPILRLFGVLVVISLSMHAHILDKCGRQMNQLITDLSTELTNFSELSQLQVAAIPYLTVLVEIMQSVSEFERTYERDSADHYDELMKSCSTAGDLKKLEMALDRWLGIYAREKLKLGR